MPTRPLLLDGETIEPSVSVPTAAAREVRGDRRAGARARAGRVAIERVRILRLPAAAAPAAGRVRRAEVRPLAQVRLAEDDRARLAQARDDERVLRRLDAGERERAGGRHHAIGGGDVVLDQDRDAVQRPARPARSCARRRADRRSSRASGLISITLRSAGPARSIASMRARYFSTSDRDVSWPDCIRCCRSAIVASSRSNGAGGCAPVRSATRRRSRRCISGRRSERALETDEAAHAADNTACRLTSFFIATLALNLAPGPDMTYVAARSLGQGRRAGLDLGPRHQRRLRRSHRRGVGRRGGAAARVAARLLRASASRARPICSYLGDQHVAERRARRRTARSVADASDGEIFRQGAITQRPEPEGRTAQPCDSLSCGARLSRATLTSAGTAARARAMNASISARRARAALARDFLAAREHRQRRNRADAEALAEIRQLVGVHLDDERAGRPDAPPPSAAPARPCGTGRTTAPSSRRRPAATTCAIRRSKSADVCDFDRRRRRADRLLALAAPHARRRAARTRAGSSCRTRRTRR